MTVVPGRRWLRTAERMPSAPTRTSPWAVGERHRHAIRGFLVSGDDAAGMERLAQPGPQDRAQRPAVDTGVRAFTLVGRAQVRL
jgi:hypothetical protein